MIHIKYLPFRLVSSFVEKSRCLTIIHERKTNFRVRTKDLITDRNISFKGSKKQSSVHFSNPSSSLFLKSRLPFHYNRGRK